MLTGSPAALRSSQACLGGGPDQIQPWQPAQLRRRFRPAEPVEQSRASDQELPALCEPLHHQPLILERRKPDAQGDVDPFLDHVDAAVRCRELHAHLRVGDQETRHDRGNKAQHQRDRACHADHPAWFGAGVVDRLLGGFCLGDHRHAVPVIDFADFGHPEMPRRTLQEPAPQPVLEQRDAAAQRRFRHAERAPGWCESAMLDDTGEIEKVIEILHRVVPFLERTVPLWPTTGKFVPRISLEASGPRPRSNPTEISIWPRVLCSPPMITRSC